MLSFFKEVEICDELESFFYVILYYAVRYLRSNIREGDVGDWLYDFFDTYGVSGNSYVCGKVKLNSMETGRLTVSVGETLKFESPMDDLIADLLKLFKARYTIDTYDRNRAKLEAIPELEVSDSSLSTRLSARRRRPSELHDSDGSDSDGSDMEMPSEGDQAPSKFERTLYEQVTTHKAMMKRLKKAVKGKQPKGRRWMPNDKSGDRVPKDYRPREQEFGPTEPASMACSKRARLDGDVRALHLSMFDLLPPRPYRTPNNSQRYANTNGLPKVRRG